MKTVRIASWSNVLPTTTTLVECPDDQLAPVIASDRPFIPRGAGRSLGDASYVTDGWTVQSGRRRGVVAFDRQAGRLECKSGTQMAELLNVLEGSGWTLPVAGGTRWVTMGGATAADIHGKNHAACGSFGNHLEALWLITADGQELECSRDLDPELFAATVGGMGLTGFITRVRLRLQRASSSLVRVQTRPIDRMAQMVESFAASRRDFQVAWLDLLSPSPRGIYYEAAYVPDDGQRSAGPSRQIEWDVPTMKLFTQTTVRLLNAVRFARQDAQDYTTHVMNFQYPVDIFKHWNRFYGRRGFQEYQFVVPPEVAASAFTEFIEASRQADLRPFFAIVKQFGTAAPAGLLSFPQSGYTLMADFESRPENQAFFHAFTERVIGWGGKIYLAKDSYLTCAQFERMYSTIERWRAIARRADPHNRLQSDLSRRLEIKPW